MGGGPPLGGGLAAIYRGSEDDFYVFRLLGAFFGFWDRFSASSQKKWPNIGFFGPKMGFVGNAS